MKVAIGLLITTTFLFKSCDTNPPPAADTVAETVGDVATAKTWGERVSVLYETSCDLRNNDLGKVRDWFRVAGEASIDDAETIHQALVGDQNVIRSLNLAYKAEKIIDSDDPAVSNGTAAVRARVAGLQGNYDGYILASRRFLN